jgi:hypothetical protein
MLLPLPLINQADAFNLRIPGGASAWTSNLHAWTYNNIVNYCREMWTFTPKFEWGISCWYWIVFHLQVQAINYNNLRRYSKLTLKALFHSWQKPPCKHAASACIYEWKHSQRACDEWKIGLIPRTYCISQLWSVTRHESLGWQPKHPYSNTMRLNQFELRPL